MQLTELKTENLLIFIIKVLLHKITNQYSKGTIGCYYHILKCGLKYVKKNYYIPLSEDDFHINSL